MKRIVGFVAVATLVATLIAGPVAAQAAAEHVPFSHVFVSDVINPCNGEFVTVTGKATGFTQELQTPSGQTRSKFFIVENGQGVDSEGNQYVFHQTINGGSVGTLPLTTNFSILIISKDATDNFVLHQVFHWNVDGQLEFIKVVGAECQA
jgi:hypothetical protein